MTLEELMTRRKLTKSSQWEPKEESEVVQSGTLAKNIPREYQREHTRDWSSSLSWVIHTEARDQKDFWYLALMRRNWEEKSLVCSPQCFKKNWLYQTNYVNTEEESCLTKLNMRVRRGKSCRKKKKLLKFFWGKKRQNNWSNSEFSRSAKVSYTKQEFCPLAVGKKDLSLLHFSYTSENVSKIQSFSP